MCVKFIKFLSMTGHDPYYIARNQLGCNLMINDKSRDGKFTRSDHVLNLQPL